MRGKRRVYLAPFKAKVALAAARGRPHDGPGGRTVRRRAAAARPGYGSVGTLQADRPLKDGGRMVEKNAEVG